MKIVTNIIKRVFSRLPLQKQNRESEQISFWNEKILKHQEDVSIKKIFLGGRTVFYKRPYEVLHTYNELFQKKIYNFKPETSTPVVFDCGSNIGLSVLYFKSLYPESVIHAYEPDSSNFKLLRQNVASNKLENVQLNEAAIWRQNGVIKFTAAGSEASRINFEQSEKSATVKAVRLADELNRYKKIDFLKIDIEGAEYEVLKDCQPYLSIVDNLFLEYHGFCSESKELVEVLSILTEAGFATYIENAANKLTQPFTNKTLGNAFDIQLNIYCYRI